MKEYNSNYLGMVIDNNDPEYRGRVQVFIPHIMPALYDGWNKEGKDIQISCVGSNMESSLGDDIVQRLRQILPWAEAASPIVGPSAPGGVVTGAGGSSQFVQSPTSNPTQIFPPGDIEITNQAAAASDAASRPWSAAFISYAAKSADSNFPGATMHTSYANAVKSGQAPGWSALNPANTQIQPGDIVIKNRAGSSNSFNGSWNGSSHGDIVTSVEGGTIRAIGGNVSDSVTSVRVNPNESFAILRPPPAVAQQMVATAQQEQQRWSQSGWKEGNSSSWGALNAYWNAAGSSLQGVKSIQSTSSSAAPPAPNPTVAPDATPQTGAPSNGMSYSPGAGTVAGTTSGGGTATTGNAKLASDRNARFGSELAANQEQVLARLQVLASREVGNSPAAIQAFTETVINRAYFSNRSLDKVLYESGYGFTDNTIATPSPAVREAFNKVMSGGNMTNLATDAGFNLPNSGRGKNGLFITGMQSKDYVIQGVIDLKTGNQVTDQALLNRLYTEGDTTGNYEFFVRQSRGTSATGIEAYAQQNGIASDGFTTDLNANLSAAGGAPSVIGNTYPYGRPHQMNTNDMANGLFAFPSVGAMVWVFFREGNPLYPVYFAASYSSSEWQRAYNGASLNSTGTNTGNPEPHKLSSRTAMNLGGGNSITNISQQDTQNQLNSYSALCVQHNSGSGLTFRDGVTEQYDKNDYFKQTDGNLWNVTHGAKETWISGPSNSNQIGNSTEFYGKWDQEAMEASKKLADMCFKYNQQLKSNKG